MKESSKICFVCFNQLGHVELEVVENDDDISTMTRYQQRFFHVVHYMLLW